MSDVVLVIFAALALATAVYTEWELRRREEQESEAIRRICGAGREGPWDVDSE